MNILHLTLKKKWFDMIASGEKGEEYREIKPYWQKRLLGKICYTHILFRHGYAKDAPTILIECRSIKVGHARPDWSDNWQGDVFKIALGKILDLKF